jgi:hypothetical protein
MSTIRKIDRDGAPADNTGESDRRTILWPFRSRLRQTSPGPRRGNVADAISLELIWVKAELD